MTGFADFYSSMLDIASRYMGVRIQGRPDDEMVKAYGPNATPLKRAQISLEDVTEFAYTAAEHHPYWGLLYNSSEITSLLLEKWHDELSKEDIKEVEWSVEKLCQALEKIRQG